MIDPDLTICIGGPLHDRWRAVSKCGQSFDTADLRSLPPISRDAVFVDSFLSVITYQLRSFVCYEQIQTVYVMDGYDLALASEFLARALLRESETEMIAECLPAWITQRRRKLAEHLWVASGVFQHNLAAMAELHRLKVR